MYFLIDFENVQSSGLCGVEYLEKNDSLTLFFSKEARFCENRYLEAIEKSGCNFDVCKLRNKGKNGLDFYIATRVGEFYGSGREERVAIISKDQGFRAVRDYWDLRLPPGKRIVLSPSIEKSLISSNENSERVKRLRKQLETVDIDVFRAGYEERRKLQKILESIFAETDFKDKTPEIREMLERGKTPKIIYLDSLHRFGRKQGLEIYNRIRSVIYQTAV